MRRFYFDRQTDVSGTSGTGAVVEGVQFSDGSVVVHWLTALSSISIYKSIEECIAIHGHDGSTNLHWYDDEPSEPHKGIEGGTVNCEHKRRHNVITLAGYQSVCDDCGVVV